jgi:hypothetical protein
MIQFTARGYIEVTLNGEVLSRHRAEREAVESCVNRGPGRYRITYPVVDVEVAGTPTPSAGFVLKADLTTPAFGDIAGGGAL